MITGESLSNRRFNETEKSERLEMVGEMAASIAHEIRNPLTSVKGFVKLIEQGFNSEDYFNHIHSSLTDIEEYLKELLLIAQPQPIESKEVNIRQLVENVIGKIKQTMGFYEIELKVEYEADSENVICDPLQMEMVIKHLLTNSIEAVSGGGKITIIVCREDTNLLIKVTDNGIGMSQERLAKLGEPYFDLKEKGTGIGLMICYRIIWQYNGSINVESEENKGTIVEVRLPL